MCGMMLIAIEDLELLILSFFESRRTGFSDYISLSLDCER